MRGSLAGQRALAEPAGLPRRSFKAQEWSIPRHGKMSKCVRRVAWLQWAFLTESRKKKKHTEGENEDKQ